MQQQHQQNAAVYALLTAYAAANPTNAAIHAIAAATATPKATKVLAAAAKDSCTHDLNSIHKGNSTCSNSNWQLHK